MKIAVVGATGLVGTKMLEVLAERDFPVTELIPVASERSAGKKVLFRGKEYTVVTPQRAIELKPQVALFSAGAGTSDEWAPKFAAAGCRVVDNSSRWRMEQGIKLIVPEVNGNTLTDSDMIIANPNCSTIQMVVALNLLHTNFKLRRIIVSTYQSVTGSGIKGINQLTNERAANFQADTKGETSSSAYPYQIDMNLIPQIDLFLENGYTKEEMKMVNETKKIMGDESIAVSATTVRVPVVGGHSESVNAEFEKPFELKDILRILKESPGVVLSDEKSETPYPMPLFAQNRDEVFVGRVRRDLSCENAINMWVVSDNLRKGAATNAVQIAELFL
ncbi:MAG: aspartate-semialdehyde dehydrogenase [Bacteroidetes bacterium HGW-Bacteroidetes-7]|jgi:aspartate-semialdehyde dehydrogenase|nr:MAG: aspartate-semialdehyde dehydrogenase [Bacteroidetes bacterium HGW-Bacteroidetes-7]